MSKCTQFTFDGDFDEWRPCTCPVCKGFLPANLPLDRQFLCRKCGAVLKTYPPLDEYMSWNQFLFDAQDDRWGGRICLVPELAIKISTMLPPRREKRRRKKKTALRFLRLLAAELRLAPARSLVIGTCL